MGHDNIYDLLSVRLVFPKGSIEDLLEFLIDHRSIVVPAAKQKEAFTPKFNNSGIIFDIFSTLAAKDKDKQYSLIRVPNKTTELREVVDWTFLPFDILQMRDAVSFASKSLSLIPELNDKMVINITDLTYATGEFSDSTQFQARVVRDFLCRSYYNRHGNVWISAAMARYVAKVYSMTMGAEFARLFALTPAVRDMVRVVFAMFFIAKMTSPELTSGFIRANARDMDFRDIQQLNQVFAFVEDLLGKDAPESIEDVITVIDAFNASSMRSGNSTRVTRSVLNMRVAKWYPDTHVSAIALEYPPYFAFLILSVLSNNRIGLSFTMKSLNLVSEGKNLFSQLARSAVFTNAI